MFVSNFHNNNESVETFSNKSSLLLKSSENVKFLVNQFNNASSEDNADNIVQCKCYNIDELQS